MSMSVLSTSCIRLDAPGMAALSTLGSSVAPGRAIPDHARHLKKLARLIPAVYLAQRVNTKDHDEVGSTRTAC